MRATIVHSALCLVLGFAASPLTANATSAALVHDTTIITGANTPGPYWITGYFIIHKSDSILTSTPVATRDYSIDYDHGRITFADTLRPSDTVVVAFQRLAFTLPSQWSLNPNTYHSDAGTVSSVSLESLLAPKPSRAPHEPIPGAITWQGYKSFSVTAGRQSDADWSQGMELSVQGDLTPGLRLNAAISDRSAGATQRRGAISDARRLSDLDRLFIEAQSTHFSGRWGELKLDQQQSARHLSGLQARWHSTDHSVSTYIGYPHGQNRRMQITLRDGELGPYTLIDNNSRARIVPGSQTVWLDGQHLNEGEDADYTLDEIRGALFLTSRARFSRQSVLVIEYEESLDQYHRTLAGAAWSTGNHDNTRRHAISLAWEGDSPRNPIFGALSQSQQEALAQDPDGHVTIDAAERVGVNDGDYVLRIDPDTVFSYAGPGQGEWRVRFEWKGEALGRYRHIVDDVYEYAGSGLGQYEPTLTLNAPTRQITVEESLTWESKRMGAINLEWQGIGDDPNRLASGTSEFHANHHIGWSIGHDSSAIDAIGLSANWVHQSKTQNQRSLGPSSFSSLVQRWHLRDEAQFDRYDEYAVHSRVPVTKWLDLDGDVGRYTNDSLSGWRASLQAGLRPMSSLRLMAKSHQRWLGLDRVDAARSDFTTSEATVNFAPRWFDASTGWREESAHDSLLLFDRTAHQSRTRWLSIARSSIAARHEWRNVTSATLGSEDVREFSLTLPLSLLRASGGSGLSVLRGARTLADGSATPYYGGRLNSVWNVSDQLRVSTELQLTHRRGGGQREVYIPTRPGAGDYRLERGEYIPDAHGDYRRVSVDDEAQLSNAYDGTKNVSVSWQPSWYGWRWSIDATRRIEARYAAKDFTPYAWTLPWSSEAAALAPGARLSLRDAHHLTVHPRRATRLAASLTHDRQDSKARTGSLDRNRLWRAETEWREELSSTTSFTTTARYESRRRDGTLWQNLDADARTVVAVIGVTPAQGLGLTLEGRYRIDREFLQNQHALLSAAKPSLRIGRGPFSATLTTDLTWLSGDKLGALSPLLSEGRPAGFSVTESAEFRWQLPAKISLNARVFSDHRPNEPDRWRMHLESVARF